MIPLHFNFDCSCFWDFLVCCVFYSVFNNGKAPFTKRHIKLLSLLNKPCAIALTNALRYRELNNLKELDLLFCTRLTNLKPLECLTHLECLNIATMLFNKSAKKLQKNLQNCNFKLKWTSAELYGLGLIIAVALFLIAFLSVVLLKFFGVIHGF